MSARVMIAGTGSGCGKTSITCAVAGALSRRGEYPVLFKCGPDYIDPMFHREILGLPSRNLDLFLCGEERVKQLLARNAPDGCIAVIEGVMGFYDGIGATAEASSHALSQATETPVILVVSPKGTALSLAAEIKGYLAFAPNNIKAVLLNRISAKMFPFYKNIIEAHCGVPALGFLPELPKAALKSRHLGLVTAAEVENLREKMNLLADAAENTIDIGRLIEIARLTPEPRCPGLDIPKILADVRVAVAKDKAFCFYYEDNLDLLREMGARLVEFSPLADKEIPAGVHGLLLGGGYPELWADTLSENKSMLESLKSAVQGGLPTIAECGGFITLCESIESGGVKYPMAAAIPTDCHMTKSLSHFGYHELTAKRDNLLCKKGETIRAHEFHYSKAENPGDGFFVAKPYQTQTRNSVFTDDTLYAGYPHLHFWGNFDLAARFLKACVKRQRECYTNLRLKCE